MVVVKKAEPSWITQHGAAICLLLLLMLWTTSSFQSPQPAFTRQQTSLLSSPDAGNSKRRMMMKKKKTEGFTINPNAAASITSDGILTDRRKNQPARPSSTSLDVPSRRKNSSIPKREKAMTKKDRQRTANGSIDSTVETRIANLDNENVQVLEAKRGNKTVTIVRGMTSPMEDRKTLLKEMKRSIGVGGTLVEGVLEIQGPHGDNVLAILKKRGYTKARTVGK